jgi:formiminotetrahydrofolate cyclodeaminase
MLVDMKLREFVETLGSKAPTPGGGSVAALSGAMAFALVEMVARLTDGKKGYERVNEEMTAVIAGATRLRDELLRDVDRDSAAYDQVTAAFKLPKQTEEEKARRTAAIQAAYKAAAELPLNVARRVAQGLPLIGAVCERGNKSATSDALSAALQANAAIAGALANVRINLEAIQDKEFVARMSDEVAALESTVAQTLKAMWRVALAHSRVGLV